MLLAPPAASATAVDPSDAVAQAVDDSVAAASADGIEQSVAVVDRATGGSVAGSGGDEQYISESIVKLFTVAYYLVKAGGKPEQALARSAPDDDHPLGRPDRVVAVEHRHRAGDGRPVRADHTSNGPKTGPHDWGWELITADDEARVPVQDVERPAGGAAADGRDGKRGATGSDGFDQSFGMNALTGDHGSKQGWTDVGSADRVQIHSVGWTDRYFVAILQTSTSSDYDTMRADCTRTAKAVLDAEATGSAGSGATSGPPVTDPPGTTAAPETSAAAATTSDAAPADPNPSPTAAPGPTAAPAQPQPAAGSQFSALLGALWHGVGRVVSGLIEVVRGW